MWACASSRGQSRRTLSRFPSRATSVSWPARRSDTALGRKVGDLGVGLAEAALFERGAWTKALEKYAAVTHLTVQLYDTDERPTCGPVHPTALFDLFTPGRHDLGIFAACIRRCLTQADMPPAVVVEEHNGLAVVGTALTLGGEIVGVAVAGYALTAFLDQHTLERLARNSGRSFETVWA